LVYSSPVRWREKALTAITHDSRDRYGFVTRSGRNDGGGRNRIMRIVRALLRTAIGSTLVGSLVCGGGGGAFAEATVDKWQYTLCDPVPDSALRSFNPDRPTKAFNPYTVDSGHFQYETDLINYAYQKTGTVRTNTILAPNPTLKLGITNNIDFELNIAPFEQ